MIPQAYKVIKSDPGNGLFEGQTANPYYEDEVQIILPGLKSDISHHVLKNGEYFAAHLTPIGGTNK